MASETKRNHEYTPGQLEFELERLIDSSQLIAERRNIYDSCKKDGGGDFNKILTDFMMEMFSRFQSNTGTNPDAVSLRQAIFMWLGARRKEVKAERRTLSSNVPLKPDEKIFDTAHWKKMTGHLMAVRAIRRAFMGALIKYIPAPDTPFRKEKEAKQAAAQQAEKKEKPSSNQTATKKNKKAP